MNKMIERSVDILVYASEHLNGFRISDVMRDLNIPKSSSFDIIHTLINCEMLEFKDEKLKIFTLGPKTYDVGYKYLKDGSIIDIAAPLLVKLGNKLSKTVFMAKYDKDAVLYVYKHQPVNAILNHCTINTRGPFYCTALGKAMLANRKEEFDYESIVFEKLTERTIMDIPTLLADLYQVRKRGYAIDNREIKDYMVCIAAPVFDLDGKCEYAISVSSLYEDMDIELIGKEVMDAASAISKKMKYTMGA